MEVRGLMMLMALAALGAAAGCGSGLSPDDSKALIAGYQERMLVGRAEVSFSDRGAGSGSVSAKRLFETRRRTRWLNWPDTIPREHGEECPRLSAIDPAGLTLRAAWLPAAAASDPPDKAGSAAPAASGQEDDLGEVSKQTANPVGKLWMLVFQYDATLNEDSKGIQRDTHSIKFQPVLPIQLTNQWKLITRPLIPIHAQTEVFAGPRHGWDRESGIGDVVLLQLFSASPPESNWVWGLGPTWVFPTAAEDTLGSEKWSVGPAATVFYLGEKWIVGGIWQNWFSFASEGDRDAVSLSDFQYVVKYRVSPTFSVGCSPNIQRNWTRDDGWSVPVGLGFDYTFKIGRMPVKVFAEAQYYVVQPGNFGPEWNFRVGIVPVIPAPGWAKTPLFGGR